MPNGNNFSSGFSLSPFGGGSPGGGMSFSYPGSGGGGGGGWLPNLLGTIGGGLMGSNPVGMGIMGIGSILGSVLGAIGAGSKQRKKEKAYEQAQRAYQDQAAKLFPELSKESFRYKNPEVSNAIQGALAYRLGNMFGDWGMPEGRQGGASSLNQLFARMMPRIPGYAYGGIVTQPQIAKVGERGPEAIVPLGQYPGAASYGWNTTLGQPMGFNPASGWNTTPGQPVGRTPVPNRYPQKIQNMNQKVARQMQTQGNLNAYKSMVPQAQAWGQQNPAMMRQLKQKFRKQYGMAPAQAIYGQPPAANTGWLSGAF